MTARQTKTGGYPTPPSNCYGLISFVDLITALLNCTVENEKRSKNLTFGQGDTHLPLRSLFFFGQLSELEEIDAVIVPSVRHPAIIGGKRALVNCSYNKPGGCSSGGGFLRQTLTTRVISAFREILPFVNFYHFLCSTLLR